MTEAVLLFAALTALFEWALLVKAKPRLRLRILGWPFAASMCFFTLNIVVHWGTMTGSMTAIVAGLASFGVLWVARKYWGYIIRVNGRRTYVPGWHKFSPEELR